jgi:patatin-like phospholipase/acyl hydrolase
MKTYRILAMDGGIGNNTATVLRMISDELKKRAQEGKITDPFTKELVEQSHFLDYVNMYTGTSAGGINSLFLANETRSDVAIDTIDQFWKKINTSLALGLLPGSIFDLILNPVGCVVELVLKLTGFRSILQNLYYLEALRANFNEKTLVDLEKNVCIVSFMLDNQKIDEPDLRKWKPKIFNNFLEDPDNKESIVDVALRTSALPIELPITQSTVTQTGPGYVDGALVANNPSMIALAQIMREKREAPDGHFKEIQRENILMLSLGTTANLIGPATFIAPTFAGGIAPWGLNQWLLGAGNPPWLPNLWLENLLKGQWLLAIQAFLSASDDAITFETKQLLEKGHYFRLNPTTTTGPFGVNPEKTAAEVNKAVDWLLSSGWFDDGFNIGADGTKVAWRSDYGPILARTLRKEKYPAP